MKRFVWLALIFVLTTACAPTTATAVPSQPEADTAVLPTHTVPPPVTSEELPATEAATAVPEPTQPPAEPTSTETIVAEPVEETVVESGVISGRTAEGAFFLGDPNAPITHIDYSDFL